MTFWQFFQLKFPVLRDVSAGYVTVCSTCLTAFCSSKWLLSTRRCTSQNKWIKRARSVLEVLCVSPQVGQWHIQDLWLWHGGSCVGIKLQGKNTVCGKILSMDALWCVLSVCCTEDYFQMANTVCGQYFSAVASLINQKGLLLVVVGIKMIWSVGNEYDKLS